MEDSPIHISVVPFFIFLVKNVLCPALEVPYCAKVNLETGEIDSLRRGHLHCKNTSPFIFTAKIYLRNQRPYNSAGDKGASRELTNKISFQLPN